MLTIALTIQTMAGNLKYPSEYPYKKVHALMFSWQDPKVGYFHTAIDKLEVAFETQLALSSITKLQINTKAAKDFEGSLVKFRSWVSKHSGRDTLLIVYYNGHGGIGTN